MNQLYHEDKFQLFVLYGRRRIGKTTLIKEFLKDKKGFFFTAQEANNYMNLIQFSKKIYDFFHLPLTLAPFENWNAAFDFISEKAKKEKFVVAFDEFPYAAKEQPEIKSIIQNCIDHQLKDTKLFLILCGSQISFMEHEVLGYKSPLYGRRTAQLHLNEFNYREAYELLKGISYEDCIKYYSCFGGTPHYLSQIDVSQTFEENIKRLYFSISGYMYNESSMLLQQELREPSFYNSIITVISSGANRITEIADKLHEDRSKVNKYIQTLIKLDVLTKTYPFGEDIVSSKKGIYEIGDNSYDFWYHFIFPNISEIESGNGDYIAEESLEYDLQGFLGKKFEKICMQYLRMKNIENLLPFHATSFGTWWGNDPKEKKEYDIDIIADNKRQKKVIIAECKWKNQIDDVKEIKKMMAKDYLFPAYKERWYCIFSKVPYSPQALQMAEENSHLILLTYEDLFR